MMRLLPSLAVCSLLAACAAPVAPPPAERSMPAALAALPGLDGEALPLWRAFDGELEQQQQRQLALQVLAANPTLQAAQARWEQAQQLARSARSLSLPQGTALASAARSRLPNAAGGHDSGNAFGLGALLSWEMDLFGGVSAKRNAAQLNAEIAAEAFKAAQLALVAEALSARQELQAQQLRVQLAKDTLAVQREVMRLIDLRLQAGRSNALDQARAQALLASTEALLPALLQAECLLQLRLQTLQGRAADAQACQSPAVAPQAGGDIAALLARAKAPAAQLATPRLLLLGRLPSPQQLLERRFDVRAATLAEQAAYAQVRQAWAARWPRLSFSGQLGWSAGKLGDLLKSDGLSSSVAGQLSGSWLDFGARAAEQDAAQAGLRAAVAQADATKLAAIEEAQGQLLAQQRLEEQVLAQRRAADAATRAREIALRRFEAGLSDFLPLLDAERERLNAEDRRLQLELARNLGLLSVAKALGGPLDERPAP